MGNKAAQKQLFLVNRSSSQPIHHIEYIAFSVGSIRGLALISAYFTLRSLPDVIVNLKGASGSSVGSLMCLAIYLKLDFDEMVEFQKNILSKNFGRKLLLAKKCNRWGLFDNLELKLALEKATEIKKVSKTFTFRDLIHFDMRIIAYDIDHHKEQLFSVDTTPDVNVIDAICASCAIPFVFSPIKVKEFCYVDGVVSNQFPLKEFQLKTTIGIFLFDEHRNNKSIKKFFETLTEQEKNHVISIDVSKMSVLDFNPTQELIDHILNQGRQAVLKYYHR